MSVQNPPIINEFLIHLFYVFTRYREMIILKYIKRYQYCSKNIIFEVST